MATLSALETLSLPASFVEKILFCCQVLELRESRLDHEETLAEVHKAADEHKRNLDRQVRARSARFFEGLH